MNAGTVEPFESFALPDRLELFFHEVPELVPPQEAAGRDIARNVDVDEVVEADAETVVVGGEPEDPAVVVDAPERNAVKNCYRLSGVFSTNAIFQRMKNA